MKDGGLKWKKEKLRGETLPASNDREEFGKAQNVLRNKKRKAPLTAKLGAFGERRRLRGYPQTKERLNSFGKETGDLVPRFKTTPTDEGKEKKTKGEKRKLSCRAMSGKENPFRACLLIEGEEPF